MNNDIVSFDDEKLILVDENDNILGYENKAIVHGGDGILHRAFSLFIFNDKKELLIQKRSQKKPLWPLYWANSVCSHPRKGESNKTAIHRRLKEEIGIDTELNFLFKFQYQAKFNEVGSENELCSIYIGKSLSEIVANPNEIAECKFVNFTQLKYDIEVNPNEYTPWLKLEFKEIQNSFMNNIAEL